MTKKSLADEVAGAKWVSPLAESSALIDAVTRHNRMFETIDRIANPLGKLGALERIAGVGLADQLAPIHKSYGATFLAAEQIAEHAKLFESITAYTAMFEQSKRLSEMYSFHKTLFDTGAFSQVGSLAEHVKNISGPAELFREYETVARLHDSIATTYGLADASRWGAGLAAIAAPSSSLLATGMFERATGVLSAFDEIGASLAWLRPGGDEPILAAAALVKPANVTASPRRLNVRCDVRCSICDDPMLVQATEFHWESEDEVVIDLGIVPICAACTRRAQEDPSYWSEHLSHLTRPRFEVIDGGGQGDRRPMGVLRAVEHVDRDGDDD